MRINPFFKGKLSFLNWNHAEYSDVAHWSKFLLEISTWSSHEPYINRLWKPYFFAFPSWFFIVSIIPSASNWFCIFMESSYVMALYVCIRLLLCKVHLEHIGERLRPKSATGARHIVWCTEVWRTSRYDDFLVKKPKVKNRLFNFFFQFCSKVENQSILEFRMDAFELRSCRIFWRSPLVEILLEIYSWSSHEPYIHYLSKPYFFCFCELIFHCFYHNLSFQLVLLFVGSSYVMAPYVCVRLLLCKDHLEHIGERLRPKSATGARRIGSCTEVWRTPQYDDF